METSIGVALSILIGILGILQGWSIFAQKRRNNRHNSSTVIIKPDGILEKLEEIDNDIRSVRVAVSRMEQRVNDCWDKLKG